MPTPQIETLRFSDGYHASARWWRAMPLRGAVLYFHGIQSHGGWYEHSGDLLARQDLTVLMPDRRGSGLNQEQRGHVESVSRCLHDAEESVEALSRETGFETVHVVGVSWGGKLAVALADAMPKRIASLSLVAPGLFPKVDLAAAEKFRIALAMLNERDRPFSIPLNDPRMFTANPERIAFLRQDTLKLSQVSASFLLASRRLDRVVRRFGKSGWQGPIHLLLAGHDQIIHNEPTQQWLDELPISNRQTVAYPDAEHTIEFEADPSQFHADLVGWISKQADLSQ